MKRNEVEESFLHYQISVKLLGRDCGHSWSGKTLTVKFPDCPRWWRQPWAWLERVALLRTLREMLPKEYALLTVQG